MDGLLLLVGHLIGDYVVQNDWMAFWKTANAGAMTNDDQKKFGKWKRPWYRWRPAIACAVHCLCYTLAVWTCSFWWMPWWGLLACCLIHWPVDRFRLAGRWMRNVSGQKEFATGPLSPWSIIVVDNTFHIATLAVIAKISAAC